MIELKRSAVKSYKFKESDWQLRIGYQNRLADRILNGGALADREQFGLGVLSDQFGLRWSLDLTCSVRTRPSRIRQLGIGLLGIGPGELGWIDKGQTRNR